jgi:hypothetical protein
MTTRNFVLAGVCVFAFAGASHAADEAVDDDTSVFGNLHLSTDYSDTSSQGYSESVPSVNVGGKISYEPAASQVGVQLDFEGSVYDHAWIKPTLPIEGTSFNGLAVAHLTYAVNDDLKLGAFGGYENATHDITKITDPTYSYLGVTNLLSATNEMNIASFGVEALYIVNDQATVQGRVGVVRPQDAEISVTDATTLAKTTLKFDLTKDSGYEFGLGGRYNLTPQLSLRADANFISILPDDGGYSNRLNTMATGQYVFSSLPIAAYVQGAFQYETSDSGSSYDTYTFRSGVAWSFGGVTPSVRGKLFRSAGYGGIFN